MDEFQAGKDKFQDLVKSIDSSIQVVIPTTPSNSLFLISLTRGKNRKFLTIPEDDILDLPHDEDILARTRETIEQAVGEL